MLIINPTFENYRREISSVPDIFENEGELIYERKQQQVRIMTFSDGRKYCTKRFPMPQIHNRFVYATGLRRSKALRSYYNGHRLLEKNIETPLPIAYVDERTMGLVGYAYLLCEVCPYTHQMYEFGNAAEGTYEEMATELARWTAKIHRVGVMHHDYSPNNILWEKDNEGKYHFTLLDLGRVYFGEVSVEMGCANFAKLWGPKRFFSLIAKEYAQCRGAGNDECERWVMEARRRFWTHYDKRDQVPFTIEL